MAGMVRGQPGLRVLTGAGHRLAVWGDPIAHSRSPRLHAAAYATLGLSWTYERRRVDDASFDAALSSLDASWRGLSLTYPLKSAAFRAARTRDARADLTGAVNTLLLTEDGPRGFNTDVGGIVAAMAELGATGVSSARVIGAGATATSAIVALAEAGAERVQVIARRPSAVDALAALGARLGMQVTGAGFDAAPFATTELTIATLPGDAMLADATADSLAASGGPLLDVVYGQWPTALSAAWQRAGAPAASGLAMLLHQAVLQVRVFLTGSSDVALDDEAAVIAAMRLALVGD